MTLAALGIAVTTQAYISTQLKADEVLVWMPLTLVLDVGAMLQMVVLIIEKHDERHLPNGVQPQDPRRGTRVLRDALIEFLQLAWRRLAGRTTHARVDYKDDAENGMCKCITARLVLTEI